MLMDPAEPAMNDHIYAPTAFVDREKANVLEANFGIIQVRLLLSLGVGKRQLAKRWSTLHINLVPEYNNLGWTYMPNLEALMEQKTFDLSVVTFLDALASSAAAPGGGGAAALAGAMAAALVSMVCNLTLGRERYAEAEDKMRQVLDRSETLRAELQQLGEDDVAAFNRLSAAYKLPRTTEADIAIRKDAIQASLKRATEVPLRTARAAAAILPLCPPVAEYGNPAAVSDIGVAALLAHAAARSALLNVEINLRTLEDPLYIYQARAEVTRLSDGLDVEAERIVGLVTDKLKGS